jgi:hypothetical protein
MRIMLAAMRTSSLLLVALMTSLGACGTSAELSRDDRDRDDRALSVRADHDEVVRLAGNLDGRPAEGPECGDACLRNDRVRSLTDQICEVARNDDHDEATQYLCEDARERQASTGRRVADCACPTG